MPSKHNLKTSTRNKLGYAGLAASFDERSERYTVYVSKEGGAVISMESKTEQDVLNVVAEYNKTRKK